MYRVLSSFAIFVEVRRDLDMMLCFFASPRGSTFFANNSLLLERDSRVMKRIVRQNCR